MKSQKILITVVFISALILIASCDKKNIKDINLLDTYSATKIDSLLQTFMDKKNVAGFAVGIVDKNKILYTKSFGVINIETKEPVTPHSIFYVASVSKPFTATAILQLAEKNEIHLDSTVSRYLPYFKLADERYKLITIRHILNHTAGFPWIEDYEYEKPRYDDSSAEQYIRSLSKISLISNPGESVNYTDMGYNILAGIILKIKGITFEEYIRNNVLKPLNMNQSAFLKSNIKSGSVTSPHILKEAGEEKFLSISKLYPYNRIHAPSGTLHTNVMDLCNWLIAWLNNGNYKGKRILQHWSCELMINEHLGWYGDKFIHHGGGDIGYRSFICFAPELSLGVAVLINSDNINANRIGYHVLWILEELHK